MFLYRTRRATLEERREGEEGGRARGREGEREGGREGRREREEIRG